MDHGLRAHVHARNIVSAARRVNGPAGRAPRGPDAHTVEGRVSHGPLCSTARRPSCLPRSTSGGTLWSTWWARAPTSFPKSAPPSSTTSPTRRAAPLRPCLARGAIAHAAQGSGESLNSVWDSCQNIEPGMKALHAGLDKAKKARETNQLVGARAPRCSLADSLCAAGRRAHAPQDVHHARGAVQDRGSWHVAHPLPSSSAHLSELN